MGRNRSRFRTLRKVIRESDPETVFVFEFSLLTLQVVLIRFFRKKKFRIISFCDDSIDMIRGNDFSRLHRIARHFVPHWVDNLILDNREARDWYRDRFGKGVYFPIIADEDSRCPVRKSCIANISVTGSPSSCLSVALLR